MLDAIQTGPALEVRGRDATETISRDELLARASFVGTRLRALGVEPTDRVAFVAPTSPTLLAAIIGTWMIGGVTTCLGASVPLRGRDRMLALLRMARPRVLVGTGDALAAIDGLVDGICCVPVSSLLGHAEAPPSPPRADAPAHVQFTSGSTGAPRGVVLRHDQLVANVVASGRRVGFRSDDRFVSWLPLFHDMGFVGGLLVPLYFGMPLCLLPTEMFVARPTSWLEAISEFAGTLSPGPTFAYGGLASRTSDERLRGLDLSSWRYAWVGAEPVFADMLERFAQRFAPVGLSAHVLQPAYGLAESTLAVTMPAPRTPTRIEHVDRDVLRREELAVAAGGGPSLPIVGVGTPIDGVQVRIAGRGGDALADRRQGRILVSGPSIATSFIGEPPSIDGGWLDTGDLGFTLDGELFITGRAKDVLIRGGVKIHPQEIEHAAARAAGVRGRTAAISDIDPARGSEQIVVVVESTSESSAVERAVRSAIADAVGVQIDRIVITRPGTIPITTSGKVQRSLLRDRLGT